VEGFMPRSRRFGFVTLNQLDARLVAHEVGHGAFNLRHTFPEAPQGSTDNLMDYPPTGGQAFSYTALLKAQWDLIHNPETTTGLFDGMEDGAAINIFSLIDDIRKANKNEERMLTISQDKCPLGRYENVKLGENMLSLLQVNCTKDFENTAIDENITNTMYEWKPDFGSKVVVRPGEKAQVFTESTLGKVVYYQFHELKIDPIPTEELTKNLMFEFVVLEKEKQVFEDYIFPKKAPLPGDPLMNMEIVGTSRETNIGGTYGCVRWTDDDDAKNCEIWEENIPNFPSINGKNKVHDGIDLIAATGTPVYSMYDGIATIATSSTLGTYILIESKVKDHRIDNVKETIWCSYGHLSNTEDINGKEVKQGQLIGYSGNSGSTANNIEIWRYHLHLTIYKGGTNKYNRTNPLPFITTKFDSNGNKIY